MNFINLSVNDFCFDEALVQEGTEIYNSEFQKVNFNCQIFSGCKIQQSKFTKCDFSNTRFFSKPTVIDGCAFSRCDFRVVGGNAKNLIINNSEFSQCDFRGVDFNFLVIKKAKFLNCKIIDTSIDINSFEFVSISGKLQEVKFYSSGKLGNTSIDFSECVLHGVEFEGCSLINCIPPKDGNHIFIDDLKAKIKKAGIFLQNEPVPSDLIKRIARRFNKLSSCDQYIFNKSFIEKIDGKEFADVFFELLPPS